MSDIDFTIDSILDKFRDELENVSEDDLSKLQADFDADLSVRMSFSVETNNAHISEIWVSSTQR